MFFGKKERDLVKQVNDELAERVVGQTIAYYAVSLEDSNYHPIYGEAVDKVTLAPVRVYAYVTVENEQTNERYGYEYQTKLTVNFNRKRLTQDQDLFVRVGDFVQYGDEFYEIARTYNDTRYYFGQVEHKFQISAECIKARRGTFRIRGEMTPQIVTSGPGAVPSSEPAPAPPPAVPKAPNNAQYVVLEATDALTQERVLTAGSNITLTDGGAGGGLTIAATGDLAPSGSALVYSSTGVESSGYLKVTGSTTLQGAISSSAGATWAGSVSSSGDIAVTGAIHATTYYGDGSNLAGVGSSASGSARQYSATGLETSGYLKVTGSTTLANSLSSSAGAVWGSSISSSGDMALTGALHAATLYGDGSGLTGVLTSMSGAARQYSVTGVETSGYLKVTGSTTLVGSLSSSAGATWASSLSSSGDVALSGALHAATLYGDGSGLTNLSADGIDVTSSTGDLSYRVVFTEDFQSDGSLGLGGNTGLVYNPTDAVLSSSAGTQIVGDSIFGGALSVSGTLTVGGTGSFSSVNASGTLSGSSTLQAVGATTLGSTLAVSGAATLAATGSFSSIVATGSISGSSTLQTVGATTLGSTLNVSGAVTVAGSVSSSGQVYAGDITLAPNAGNATPQILFTSPGGGAEITSTGAGTFNLVSNAVLELRAGSSSDLQLGADGRTGDIVLGSAGQLSSSYGAAFVQSVSSSGDVAVTGNVHAASYYGDGSNLTGVDAVSGSARQYSSTGMETSGYLKASGSVTLAGTGSVSSLNMTGTLSASSTARFGSSVSSSGDVAVTGNVHAAAYYGDGANLTNVGVSGSARHYSVAGFETSGYLKVTGSTTLAGAVSSSAGAVLVGSISSSGDTAVTGNVHAAAYYGDGSNLTGIGAAAVSGSARHYSVTGLETSGYLRVTGSTTLVGTGSLSSVVATGSISGSSTLQAVGAVTLGAALNVSGSSTFGGGITYPRSAITAATYTVLVTDYYIGVDPTSNAVTLTLPVAAAAGTGKTYVIKDETGQAGANAITIDGDGSETIDGVASFDINSPYGAAHFYTDGSNWFIY
jgi:hypothetical protein